MKLRLCRRPVVIAATLVVLFGCAGWVSDTAAQETEMDILTIRTCQMSSSKTVEAQEWAIEVHQYLNGKYPGRNSRVYVQAFGPLGQVSWFSSYKDLAAVAEFRARLAEDSGYQDRLRKTRAAELFTGCEDKLYTAIR
jgi:hypothetical protein